MNGVHLDVNGRLFSLFQLILSGYSNVQNIFDMENKQPTYGNGKICYLEIPANDIEVSASFYEKSVGWKIRRGNDHVPSMTKWVK